MGLKRRNGNVYYYRSRRVGKRVLTEYVAAGPAAELAARWEAVRAARRELDKWDLRHRLDRLRRRAARVRGVLDRAAAVVADALQAAGWHRHHRGEWRKRKEPAMTTEVATVTEAPTWVPSELRRRAGVLDKDAAARAGKGDRSALPAVRAYLDNPAAVALWGDAGMDVMVRWVKMQAGGDLVAEEATLRHASALRAGLAGPSPSALDRLLAERVVLAWVVLTTLEVWQARTVAKVFVSGKAKQVGVLNVLPKHIDAAHRQLMAACRTLAKVRRARLPEVLALVNVAAPGSDGGGQSVRTVTTPV